MKKKYYGIYGKRGFTVVDDFEKVNKIREMLKSITCKKFDTFEEAVYYARMNFLEMNEDLYCLETPGLGQVIFASKLKDYDNGRW